MIKFGNEEYKVWSTGIYSGMLYDIQRRKNGQLLYHFYAGVSFNSDKEDDILIGNVTKNGLTPVTEDDITDSFIAKLSSKIINYSCEQKPEEYRKYFKCLPKAFYTEKNCEAILNQVLRAEVMVSNRDTEIAEACESLTAYAVHTNDNGMGK